MKNCSQILAYSGIHATEDFRRRVTFHDTPLSHLSVHSSVQGSIQAADYFSFPLSFRPPPTSSEFGIESHVFAFLSVIIWKQSFSPANGSFSL
jgi:hypothetical protein